MVITSIKQIAMAWVSFSLSLTYTQSTRDAVMPAFASLMQQIS